MDAIKKGDRSSKALPWEKNTQQQSNDDDSDGLLLTATTLWLSDNRFNTTAFFSTKPIPSSTKPIPSSTKTKKTTPPSRPEKVWLVQ